MIEAFCSKCGKEIHKKAALLISPPDERAIWANSSPKIYDSVDKYHLCRDCWDDLVDKWLCP